MTDERRPTGEKPIADKAMDRMSVAPDAREANDEKGEPIHDPRQEAGQDASISERLERNPESKQAQLDNALDESMDASDPPATTQPSPSTEPPKSSGYDAAAEAERQQDA